MENVDVKIDELWMKCVHVEIYVNENVDVEID